MPATNYTPIQLYRSTTSGNLPLAANLSPGELALNIADNDMTMYMENASGVVKSFFNNPAALKYPTADGTSGQIIQTNGAGVLSFGSAPSSALTNNTRQAVTSSATTTINLNSGNVIDLTMAGSITTLSFTNVPASGTPILIQIVVRNASDGTANSVYWSGQYALANASSVQTAPALATGPGGVTVIALLTTDGGTKWRGWVEATIPGSVLGSLYAWGDNDAGQLGQNDRVFRSSPVQVGALTNWVDAIACQYTFGAINSAGQLFTWGTNNFGQLGQNVASSVTLSSPVQVGSLTNWSKLTGYNLVLGAIKTDGTIWTWGYNNWGQLGLGDRVSRSSPTQVGSASWASFIMTCSPASSIAVRTNGTLWSWGHNGDGQLGLNDRVARSSPAQIGSATTWAKAGPCAAITQSGALWVWGRNGGGELGQNDLVFRSSPVQVGSLTHWQSFCSRQPFNQMVITTDNKLFAWGYNSIGCFGTNSTVDFSSPVQIGGTDWASGTSSQNVSLFVKTNKQLWAWGRNSNSGQLGLNDRINRSSPVQVGSDTDWQLVTSFNCSGAIRGPGVNPA
jgi:alpha-tubulin suppressor-like RCC1 family protein